MMHRLVEVKLDAKRRLALPSHLLEEVGIRTTARLVAHMEGPGRLVVETVEAAVEAAGQRIWADLDLVETGNEATTDVRVMRDEDTRIADDNAARRSDVDDASSATHVDEAGRRLLAALGLPGV